MKFSINCIHKETVRQNKQWMIKMCRWYGFENAIAKTIPMNMKRFRYNVCGIVESHVYCPEEDFFVKISTG